MSFEIWFSIFKFAVLSSWHILAIDALWISSRVPSRLFARISIPNAFKAFSIFLPSYTTVSFIAERTSKRFVSLVASVWFSVFALFFIPVSFTEISRTGLSCHPFAVFILLRLDVLSSWSSWILFSCSPETPTTQNIRIFYNLFLFGMDIEISWLNQDLNNI